MKKSVILLAAVSAFALAGCGKKEPAPAATESAAATTEAAAPTDAATTAAATGEASAAATPSEAPKMN